MRLLIASMMMCCCAVAGYSQETTAAPEAPVEITSTDDAGDQVAVQNDAHKETLSGDGCGCGKDSKPKI